MRETIINLPGLGATSTRFRRRLCEVADEVHTQRDFLATVIGFETGKTFLPHKRNPLSHATGLIQFLPVTAHLLGTTIEALAEMSDVEQLSFVAKYLRPYIGRMATLADTYFAVFYPAAIGKAASHVLFRRGDKAYEQNAGFDRMHTGQITCGDVVATVAKLYELAIVRPRLPIVDTDADTDPPPAAAEHPTIRIGSSGPAVSAWQMLVGVVADGQFGQRTEAATIAWQVSRGLEADGVVGPKTWAAAPHVADLEDLGGGGEA